MKQLPVHFNTLPDELLLQIIHYLPYRFLRNLAFTNRKFNELLRCRVQQEGLELRKSYHLIDMQNLPIAHPDAWTLLELVMKLVRGDLPGEFIEELAFSEALHWGEPNPPQISDMDKAVLESAISQVPLLSSHTETNYSAEVIRGEEWAMFAVTLPYLSNLRQLWLPFNWDDNISVKNLINSIISQNMENLLVTSLKCRTPLHRLSHLRVQSCNGEWGPGISDLYPLLILPSLRILCVQHCETEEYESPQPYPEELALSRVQKVVFMGSCITKASILTFADAIGVPCTIMQEWGISIDSLIPLEQCRWKKCEIGGQVDADTGLIQKQSRSIDIRSYDRDSPDCAEVDRMVWDIANSFLKASPS